MQQDIMETAKAAGSFKTLVAALEAADLVETLKGDGPFTVFAPTDEAFSKLPAGAVASLLDNEAQLAKILTYHVVPGRLHASDVAELDGAATVQGGTLPIEVNGGVIVGGAQVVQPDVEASNGVIHVIDRVLAPPA